MSESIDITKKLDLDIDGNSLSIDKEINIQVDYVECKECGNNLDFSMVKDSFGDIQITVAKCECPAE